MKTSAKYANFKEDWHDEAWYCDSKNIVKYIDADTDQEFFICNDCQYTWEKEK